ncbi:MAG: hypothetical protein P8Y10_03595 [Gemmatimonadales bacterium]
MPVDRYGVTLPAAAGEGSSRSSENTGPRESAEPVETPDSRRSPLSGAQARQTMARVVAVASDSGVGIDAETARRRRRLMAGISLGRRSGAK